MNPARFQRLKELFEAALEHDPARRESFLIKACSGDEDLRRELSSLLASHREGDSFLETSAVSGENDTLREGQSVGPYLVGQELGRGGMGVVYLAEDTRLHRKVALKALTPKFLFDSKQQERFRREATLAASLSHPAIATIYALEEVEGRLYIVSEYVPGETLRAALRHAPLPIDTVLAIGLQIAEGLAAAHEKGIVHRDLKPENAIRDSQGKLKILDFGLAFIPELQPLQERLTEAGTLLGTPSYMSPEQLRGDSVDFRSDLFSFGVLLYELAAGEHPFLGKTAIATAAKILETGPPAIERLSREAPRLEKLIQQCLNKEPQQRYQSARQLADELRAVASSRAAYSQKTDLVEPVERGKPPEEVRLGSYWWVVHQTLVVVLYAVMVVVLWQVKQENRGLATLLPFYGVLACAIANGALRIHLLFTARFNRPAFQREMSGVAAWLRRFDWTFIALLAAAAAAVFLDRHLMAGILAAVAVGYLVVFLVVEPATIRAVFPDSNQADR